MPCSRLSFSFLSEGDIGRMRIAAKGRSLGQVEVNQSINLAERTPSSSNEGDKGVVNRRHP